MVNFKMLGVTGLLMISSCASAFPYKWYGLNANSYEGSLQGPSEEEDLPLRLCEPDDVVRGKCVVLFIEEFESLKGDLLTTKERLKACESELEGKQ